VRLQISDQPNLDVDVANLTESTTYGLVGRTHIRFAIPAGDRWNQRKQLSEPPRRDSAVVHGGGGAVQNTLKLSSQNGRLFIKKRS
jgi:hypothetical protein